MRACSCVPYRSLAQLPNASVTGPSGQKAEGLKGKGRGLERKGGGLEKRGARIEKKGGRVK